MKRDWLQITSNIAIILGLGIVIYELEQTRELSFTEGLASSGSVLTARTVSMMGEDPRQALLNAALYPDRVTELDVVALDALYLDVARSWFLLAWSEDVDGIDRNWEGVIHSDVWYLFKTEPGGRWLKLWLDGNAVNPNSVIQKVVSVGRQALANDPPNPINTVEGRYRAILPDDA